MSSAKPVIPDILASRYASPQMCHIWSQEGRVLLERELWIAVMQAQKSLGIDIPQEAIEAYERVKHDIRIERINERERVLRHDVKSRIEEFCELAGHEHIHKGMTSRDLTDNVEQLQVFRSLEIIRVKYIAALGMLAEWSKKTRDLMMVGRTHNVPAQPITLGKRLAMFGEEMLVAFRQLESLMARYPLRGIQGAVGSQLDQRILLQDNETALRQLESDIRKHLGFQNSFNAVGQVYPRSLDEATVHGLFHLSSGISSFAKTLRLMAGQSLATEGFQKGQVGSSAMPHKMNSRSSERINGFHSILNGYVNMLMGLSGDQWNEGDVSCSVVRRVALPGAMFAMDGELETFMTILKEMGFYEQVIAQELAYHLPFLATTSILMACVQKGCGRELAHEAIKENAIAVVDALRRGEMTHNPLPERLASDPRLPLSLDEIQAILNNPRNFVASSSQQVMHFADQVEQLMNQYPHARNYTPQPII
ncbi:MAG: adenylosuccinate lyase [SAR324 cluster bacterium]|nr:adenylosuccinate lyase [SAR324 cluster bacterium]